MRLLLLTPKSLLTVQRKTSLRLLGHLAEETTAQAVEYAGRKRFDGGKSGCL